MICNKCGYMNNDNDRFCGMCGETMPDPVQGEPETPAFDYGFSDQDFAQPDYSQQNYQQDFSQPDFAQQDFSQQSFPQQPVAEDPGKTLGLVGMVLGILGMTICNGTFFVSIAAIICGSIGMKKSKEAGFKNTFGLVGVILGPIGIIGFILLCILIVVYSGAVSMIAMSGY